MIKESWKMIGEEHYFDVTYVFVYKIEEKTSDAPEIIKLSFPKLVSISLPGPNLELLCVRQSDAAFIHENYAKLYFHAKHLEKALNRGVVNFLVPFFQKSILFGQYPTLP